VSRFVGAYPEREGQGRNDDGQYSDHNDRDRAGHARAVGHRWFELSSLGFQQFVKIGPLMHAARLTVTAILFVPRHWATASAPILLRPRISAIGLWARQGLGKRAQPHVHCQGAESTQRCVLRLCL
jgi:hypothetical protein